MYKTVNGDLVEMAKQNDFDAILHGCNCFHVMGGGIAKTIAHEFPDALKEDKEKTKYGDYLKLGKVTAGAHELDNGNGLIIFNGYTQFGYGQKDGPYESHVHVDYNAVASVFRSIVRYDKVKLRIGFPMIGSGLANGNWDIISDIIEKEIISKDNIHEWTLVKFVNNWTSIHE